MKMKINKFFVVLAVMTLFSIGFALDDNVWYVRVFWTLAFLCFLLGSWGLRIWPLYEKKRTILPAAIGAYLVTVIWGIVLEIYMRQQISLMAQSGLEMMIVILVLLGELIYWVRIHFQTANKEKLIKK